MIDPRWLTSNVCDLTTVIESNRNILPTLSDALMDAGCDDEQLIAYLRCQDDTFDTLWKWWEITWKRPVDARDILGALERWSVVGTKNIIDPVVAYATDVGSPSGYDADLDSNGEPGDPETFIDYATRPGDTWENYMRMGSNENYKRVKSTSFWRAYSILTGEDVTDRSISFSCAC